MNAAITTGKLTAAGRDRPFSLEAKIVEHPVHLPTQHLRLENAPEQHMKYHHEGDAAERRCRALCKPADDFGDDGERGADERQDSTDLLRAPGQLVPLNRALDPVVEGDQTLDAVYGCQFSIPTRGVDLGRLLFRVFDHLERVVDEDPRNKFLTIRPRIGTRMQQTVDAGGHG
ncbi:MAG: hypothetical protein ACKVP7_08100 [Hyphomicrobiaceae bacterium]